MAKQERVLLITAASLVGDYLALAFARPGYTVVETRQKQPGATHSHAVDLRDRACLERLFEREQPDIVLLCAALTNVDYCETHQQEAYAVNVAGPQIVAGLCADKAKLVFFSSDYVFDGKAGPYSEEDQPAPVDYYGQCKLEAEELIRRLVKRYLIIRTTVVYGNESAGKNFACSLVSMLARGESRRVPRDQIGNPTYGLNLARIVEELVRADCRGIFNVVGADLIDRYRFALEICSVFGLNKDLIIPVTTADFKQPAQRPLKAGLRTEKVRAAVSEKPMGVREGLTLFKKELQCKN
ncbi:MAG TPA: SDR family oxidoreductase [Candidatus Omnitrophota bacterium]|nr:SDR family oxidoreductase [Candidatus Omnitrophota bacterium]HRZ15175.1 SDR family oxidoreductase [Candidatus Omnitrophota bacterium]